MARQTGSVSALGRISEILTALPESKKGFLAETPQVKEWSRSIAHRANQLEATTRPFLQEPVAAALVMEIEHFRDRVAGLHQPLAKELRTAAGNWLEIAKRKHQAAAGSLRRQPVHQVFRAGDPVDPQQEAFLPRYNVIGELEQQIMLATGCPGLLLYGRRRTGKSTVIKNVGGFLPSSVTVVSLSMQSPLASTSLDGLVELIAATIRGGIPKWKETPQPKVDLSALFTFLGEADQHLQDTDQRLILAIDEYENIDVKIGQGVFPEDLLGTLRESFQTHRNLTWMLAGSHHFTELSNAPWSSYLVSARTIEVPMFTEAETRLLLTEPLKHSRLWEEDDPKRPRFQPEFWGTDGIERIHQEAGGWPHLVQLLAETIIDRLNDTGAETVDSELLEAAFDKAVERGDAVLYELLRRECTLDGEWAYLEGFRTTDTQPPPENSEIARSLKRRLLVQEEGAHWRLRVPLMARWLRQRG